LDNPDRALKRGNYVLARTLAAGAIDKSAYRAAVQTRELAAAHEPRTRVSAPYVAEMARQFVIAHGARRRSIRAWSSLLGSGLATASGARMRSESNDR